MDKNDLSESDRRMLASLMGFVFGDISYHRNYHHKLVLFITAINTAFLGLLFSQGLSSLRNAELAPLILFVVVLEVVLGYGIVSQILTTHMRSAGQFFVLFKIESLLGLLDENRFGDYSPLFTLPYDIADRELAGISDPNKLPDDLVFRYGKRGYLSFCGYVAGLCFSVNLLVVILKGQHYSYIDWLLPMLVVFQFIMYAKKLLPLVFLK